MRLVRGFGVAMAVAAMVTGAVGAAAPGKAAATPSYSYLSGLAAQLGGPDTAPPGANDWHCRPTAKHRNPVVLLHGLSNDTITWNTMSPVLSRAGYCVFSTTYGRGGMGPVGAVTTAQVSAHQIARFIDRVRAATGAGKVDLVGHSMGGAIPFYYLGHLGGLPKVDHYVALAAPFHGSTLSGVATALAGLMNVPGFAQQCGGPCQFNPGAPFLRELNPDPAIAPDIRFTTIVSRYDEIATPFQTGLLYGPNVRRVVLQDRCATDYTEHYELPADPIAVREVLNSLDPSTARPADCTTVLPFVGPIGGADVLGR
ncbi:triacylglycerol lipase [Gordonia sp. X0973]|uniref:esterase/lipase family protein n=1 Tax=Gordonia sp. X0973 TaxID=2742602 RepID=UPI000F52DFA1|nr:alpha/beta fold hydrolase [Gordonia sp. X0973]